MDNGQGWFVSGGAGGIVHHIFVTRNRSILAENEPRHVRIKGMPGTIIKNFTVGVPRKRTPTRVHPRAFQ